MDAASPADPTRHVAPKEDDLSLCMNCGAPYVRHRDRWLPMTNAERAAMTNAERAEFDLACQSRRAAIRTDPTRGRGGRA
jgi:hypothetical protein